MKKPHKIIINGNQFRTFFFIKKDHKKYTALSITLPHIIIITGKNVSITGKRVINTGKNVSITGKRVIITGKNVSITMYL